MDSIVSGLAIIVLIVSLVTFFSLQYNISTVLSPKIIIIGGVLSAAGGVSVLILARAPFNESFVFVIICMSILGSMFIFARRIGDKIFTRYNKYTSVSIRNVILTDDVNEAGSPTRSVAKFRQTDRRIYCFVTHMSFTGVYLGATLLVKWFFEGKEIQNSIHRLQANRPILAELRAPEEDRFHQGRYTVELFIGYTPNKVRVKTVEFEVI